jgi:hypothetical protein
MTHNDENSPAGRGAKQGKSPHPDRRAGLLTRMTHDQVPLVTGGGTQTHED